MCVCVCERRAWVQLWFSSGHLHMTGLICLRLAWILHQHCYTSHSPQPDPPLASSPPHNLCLLFCATPSFLPSHPPDCCHSLSALSLSSPSLSPSLSLFLPLSFFISVCLPSCAVLQGSLADVIYAISFASVRRERPEANALHAECSCGRLWASAARAHPLSASLRAQRDDHACDKRGSICMVVQDN